MKSVAAVAFALVAGLCYARIEYRYPLGVKTCADDQADVNVCRQNALQEAVPLLAAGIPGIGAAPIDPMDQLPTFTWKGNSRGISIRYELTSPRISGFGGSIVDQLQTDAEGTVHVVTHIPGEFTLEGVYTLDGEIMNIPLKGNGKFKAVLIGSANDVTYKGHPETGPGGQTYLKLDSVAVKLSYGKSNYEFGGLFGGYPPLAQAANLFINKVSAPVLEREMRPALEKWLSSIYLQKAQAVFSTVPYEKLFPKTEEA